eukprot:3121248-Heterocapsa_arctica.AAC.1
MAQVFDKLLHSSTMQKPEGLAPVERANYKWDLEMRDIWKGTQLRDAWVQDRITLLAAWGMAIALTQ